MQTLGPDQKSAYVKPAEQNVLQREVLTELRIIPDFLLILYCFFLLHFFFFV